MAVAAAAAAGAGEGWGRPVNLLRAAAGGSCSSYRRIFNAAKNCRISIIPGACTVLDGYPGSGSRASPLPSEPFRLGFYALSAAFFFLSSLIDFHVLCIPRYFSNTTLLLLRSSRVNKTESCHEDFVFTKIH